MTTILWTRLDRPGHETARLEGHDLRGTAVFLEEAMPVRLDYHIVCGQEWRTERATVDGWLGDREVSIVILSANGHWTMNGEEVPAVSGCIDIDLNFSPSTNLLPIRRLALAVGESAAVRAAWLRFPGFRLEVLEQTYHRLAHDLYTYESGNFKAEIRVTEEGLPVEYAGLWRAAHV